MEYETILDKKGKDEISSLFKWIKKSDKNIQPSKLTQHGHCNNYATQCCLNCDKCWGGRYKTLE